MSLSVEIISFKCFNQLRNGKTFNKNLNEFTPNLVGNIGETIQVQYEIKVFAFTEASKSNKWNVAEDRIERGSGSFYDDGLVVGDIIQWQDRWNEVYTGGSRGFWIGEIDFISQDGKVIEFTITSGSSRNLGQNDNVALVVRLSQNQSENRAALIKFGIIGNNEPFNFKSKVSDNEQVYYGSDIDGVTSDMISLGNIKDWQSGDMTVSQVTSVEDPFDVQVFTFVHTFIINPWYTLDFRQNIVNDTIPDALIGENSFKYALESDIRKTLTDTRTSKKVILENIEGVTGWFNENFNGFNNLYEVESVDYEEADTLEALEGVIINGRTRITAVVKKKTGSISANYSASTYISYTPDNESEYKDVLPDLQTNFIYKSEILSNPDTISGDLSGSLSAGKLTLTWIVEYTVAEKIRLTKDSEYLFWIQIEDSSLNAGDSDRVALLGDFRSYVDIDFVAGFVNFEKYNFLNHDQVLGIDVGSSILSDQINEDGILLDARFSIDKTKEVIVNSFQTKLVAYNTLNNSFFELDSYSFDLSSAVINSSGFQDFSVLTSRGYEAVGQFDLVEFVSDGEVGSDRFSKVTIGQKIKWQDWIFNSNVGPVFIDDTKANRNLNFKSSNYSGLNDYQIKIISVLNVSGIDILGRSVSGDVINIGGNISVGDYKISGIDPDGLIETIDLETNIHLGGSVLYNGKDTLFRTTLIGSNNIAYAISRIEPVNNSGDGIFELSSLLPSSENNLLKPLDGESFLKTTPVGSDTIAECLVDGTKIQEGISYKLSTRFETDPPISFVYVVSVSAGETISLPMTSGNDSLYNLSVDFGDGSGNKTVSAYADPDRLHTYVSAGNYEIIISGQFDYIRFLDSPNSIVELKSFGTAGVGDSSFLNCSNLSTVSAIDIPSIYLNELTSCFQGANISIFDVSINLWDVSSVADFSKMFQSSSFNQDITGWNMSSAENMSGMFASATLFNQNISTWDVSGVLNMSSLFNNADSFNQNINIWNVSNVTTMANMFEGNSGFNQTLSSWNVQNVTSMFRMFTSATAFNQNLSTWTLSSCSTIGSMFQSASSFNNGGAALTWGGTASISIMSAVFASATTFNQSIISWDVSNVTTMASMFSNADSFNQNINGWNVSSVTTMASMFEGNSGFNQPLNSWTTSSITNLSRMFFTATAFNQNIGSWDVDLLSNATDMFVSATLSTSNYDALLVGWESQAVQNSVAFNGGNSTYTAAGAGGTARAALISDHSWVITDAGGI